MEELNEKDFYDGVDPTPAPRVRRTKGKTGGKQPTVPGAGGVQVGTGKSKRKSKNVEIVPAVTCVPQWISQCHVIPATIAFTTNVPVAPGFPATTILPCVVPPGSARQKESGYRPILPRPSMSVEAAGSISLAVLL